MPPRKVHVIECVLIFLVLASSLFCIIGSESHYDQELLSSDYSREKTGKCRKKKNIGQGYMPCGTATLILSQCFPHVLSLMQICYNLCDPNFSLTIILTCHMTFSHSNSFFCLFIILSHILEALCHFEVLVSCHYLCVLNFQVTDVVVIH